MTVETQADSELWSSARAGSEDALGVLFDRHHGRVYSRALWLLGNVHDAQDATAAVFFELWHKRGHVREVDGSVLPWLLVTTSRVCRNISRGTRRYRALLQRLPRGDSATSAEGAAIAAQDVLDAIDPEVANALRRLPPQTYSLLILTALEGYPVAQAAEAVGISQVAAKTRLSRARHHVRAVLLEAQGSTAEKEYRQ